MDDYFLKDGKTAAQKLNSDLDDYWKTKPAGEGAAAEPEAEAPAEEEAVAEEEAAAE